MFRMLGLVKKPSFISCIVGTVGVLVLTALMTCLVVGADMGFTALYECVKQVVAG